MTQVTWLGDADPTAQVITQGGVRFVKGEPVAVKDEALLKKLKDNPLFSTEKSAEPAKADEPEAPDVDAGTEKGAIRDQLRALGVTVQGNPSLDTLRGKLAEALK